MKHACKWRLWALAVLLAVTQGGCTNTLVFLERTKAAVSVEVNGNPAEPVELTAGYKRSVVAFVPPKMQSTGGKAPHQGEALSLLSTFGVKYDRPTDSTLGDLVIENRFASGKAAVNLAKNPQRANEFLVSHRFASTAQRDVQTYYDRIDVRSDAEELYGRAALVMAPTFQSVYQKMREQPLSNSLAFRAAQGTYVDQTDEALAERRMEEVAAALAAVIH